MLHEYVFACVNYRTLPLCSTYRVGFRDNNMLSSSFDIYRSNLYYIHLPAVVVVVAEEDDDGVAAGGEEEEALAWKVAWTVESGALMVGGAGGLEQVRGLRQLGVLPEALTGAFALLAAALCSLCSAATLA